MIWVIRGKMQGEPYYDGAGGFRRSRGQARRYATSTEALRDVLNLRVKGLPVRLMRVGTGLGVRMPTAEAKALRDVAAKAWSYLNGPQAPTNWALKLALHNAIAHLRRVAPPATSEDAGK